MSGSARVLGGPDPDGGDVARDARGPARGSPDPARAAVEAAHREHWGSVLGATVALTRDLDLAEDAAQDAFVQALTAWRRDGVPASPGGWLATAARRRALDRMRREQTLRRKLPLLVWDEDDAAPPMLAEADPRLQDEDPGAALDEKLRLIFLAAHPALAAESRVALTLRLVGGLSTAQIAAAFLVGEATMAARLTRAKKRIVLSRIPCRVPGPESIGERLVDVLDVVSVLLASAQRDGSEEVLAAAVQVLEALLALLPAQVDPAAPAGRSEHAAQTATAGRTAQAAQVDPAAPAGRSEHAAPSAWTEVAGLLAQALALQARAATRHDAEGRPVALAAQDRGRWDRALLERADRLVVDGLGRGGRGPYLLQGAIAAAVAVPPRHEDVDWEEVVALYDALLEHWPTAIVRLGRIVALGEARGPGEALAQLEPLAEELAGHRPFHVIRAELLGRIGAHEEAAEALRTALECRGSEGESALLRELVRGA